MFYESQRRRIISTPPRPISASGTVLATIFKREVGESPSVFRRRVQT